MYLSLSFYNTRVLLVWERMLVVFVTFSPLIRSFSNVWDLGSGFVSYWCQIVQKCDVLENRAISQIGYYSSAAFLSPTLPLCLPIPFQFPSKWYNVWYQYYQFWDKRLVRTDVVRSNERSGKDIRSDIDDNVGMWNVTWFETWRKL